MLSDKLTRLRRLKDVTRRNFVTLDVSAVKLTHWQNKQNEMVKLANWQNEQNEMVKLANWQNEQNEKCLCRFSHSAQWLVGCS